MTPHKLCSYLRPAVFTLLLCAGGRLFGLGTEAMLSMVIVEGDEGRGSAFVVKMEGKPYLITNSHVIRGNKNVKFKTLSNQELETGPLQIADRMDLVRAEIPHASEALELLLKAEQHLKIGDEVLVAGNSEGEGVVREIPGKVVGIGPDRIEVDAEFVPGNSGSPILLKSTGQVVGVATYMKVPWSVRVGWKSPTSLNEVRRFGYRVDTVGKWITPATPDRIMVEGQKLAQLEQTANVVASILSGGTSRMASRGGAGFVSKDRAAANPSLASLAAALDEYSARAPSAKLPEEKKQHFMKLFDKIKAVVAGDIHGFKEENFSGYFALQFKEHLEERKQLNEWLESTINEAAKNSWTINGNSFVTIRRGTPPVDVSKLDFVLAEYTLPDEPPEQRHHVHYPSKSKPKNMDNLFWVVEPEKGPKTSFAMHTNGCHVPATKNGSYRVYIEHRTDGVTKCVSNVLVVKITDIDESKGKEKEKGKETKPAEPAKPAVPQPGIASKGAFNGTDPWSGEVTVTASSMDAFPVGAVKKGTKISLQYLSGKWKAHGRLATTNPDSVEADYKEEDRAVIALPSEGEKPGKVLATVPGGTAKTPFVFEADKNLAGMVLRIYGQKKFASNPGSVKYKVKIVPAGR